MPKVKSALELFLPEGTLEWFDVIDWDKDDNVSIILEEKNIPPLKKKHKNKKVISKGFTDITITDFPIRGKRALLTFRRRRWQVDGEKKLLTRDIKLAFPGTQLEKEFADFLKEDGGRATLLPNFYRKVSMPPDQGI